MLSEAPQKRCWVCNIEKGPDEFSLPGICLDCTRESRMAEPDSRASSSTTSSSPRKKPQKRKRVEQLPIQETSSSNYSALKIPEEDPTAHEMMALTSDYETSVATNVEDYPTTTMADEEQKKAKIIAFLDRRCFWGVSDVSPGVEALPKPGDEPQPTNTNVATEIDAFLERRCTLEAADTSPEASPAPETESAIRPINAQNNAAALAFLKERSRAINDANTAISIKKGKKKKGLRLEIDIIEGVKEQIMSNKGDRDSTAPRKYATRSAALREAAAALTSLSPKPEVTDAETTPATSADDKKDTTNARSLSTSKEQSTANTTPICSAALREAAAALASLSPKKPEATTAGATQATSADTNKGTANAPSLRPHLPQTWDDHYSLLLKYKEAHGHVILPRFHVLWPWLQQQKIGFEQLPEKRILSLQKLGILFSKDPLYQKHLRAGYQHTRKLEQGGVANGGTKAARSNVNETIQKISSSHRNKEVNANGGTKSAAANNNGPGMQNADLSEVPEKKKSMQIFDATVPPGIKPGQVFSVKAGDRMVGVKCPPHVKPGQKVRFQIPTTSAVAPNTKLCKTCNTLKSEAMYYRYQWCKPSGQGDCRLCKIRELYRSNHAVLAGVSSASRFTRTNLYSKEDPGDSVWDKVPEEWEINIIEKNKNHPWWDGLRSAKPEPEVRRSARLSKGSKEKRKMESTEEETRSGCLDEQPNGRLHTHAKSTREERAKRRQLRFDAPPDEQLPKKKKQTADAAAPAIKTTPNKDDCTGSDSEEVEDSGMLLSQPCTIINGDMTSAYISLALPLLPTKLGLILRDNHIFGHAELRSVSTDTSSLGTQIPIDFRKDSFIISIESKSIGRLHPASARDVSDILNWLRWNGEFQVVVNFSKNPLALYMPKDDPMLHLQYLMVEEEELKQCYGPCGTKQNKDGFSLPQWESPNRKSRLCLECEKMKMELGRHYKDFTARTPKLRDLQVNRKRCWGCEVEKIQREFSHAQWVAPYGRHCLVCTYNKDQLNEKVQNDAAQIERDLTTASVSQETPPTEPRIHPETTKKCNGTCGLEKTKENFTCEQWDKERYIPRYCKRCIKRVGLDNLNALNGRLFFGAPPRPTTKNGPFSHLSSSYDYGREERRQCTGRCRTAKTKDQFSLAQWNSGGIGGHAWCIQCMKANSQVGLK